MQKIIERKVLMSQLIESFSKEREVYAIYLFGKEVNGQTDEYSDIDMVICSNDLAATRSKCQSLFNDISPVVGLFLLNSEENDFSQMVMLKDFSPYQKIDFSIADCIETKISAGFGPFMAVYKDESLRVKPHSKLDVIEEDSVKHQLENFLFAVPRFTKCLFRKDYDMYRRWKNTSDDAISLLHEKYFGWKEMAVKNNLSIKELSKLNQVMNQEDKEIVDEIFPSSGTLNMAESYKSCIDLLISLCRQKADYFGVELNENLIRHIERFMDTEITRYIKPIQ